MFFHIKHFVNAANIILYRISKLEIELQTSESQWIFNIKLCKQRCKYKEKSEYVQKNQKSQPAIYLIKEIRFGVKLGVTINRFVHSIVNGIRYGERIAHYSSGLS